MIFVIWLIVLMGRMRQVEKRGRFPYFMAFALTLGNAIDTTPDNIGDLSEAKATVSRFMSVMNRLPAE